MFQSDAHTKAHALQKGKAPFRVNNLDPWKCRKFCSLMNIFIIVMI